MTMTLSPQSTCGVKVGRCLPRRRVAMTAAKRPSTTPEASITTHCLVTSAGLRLKVFIDSQKRIKPRDQGRHGKVAEYARIPFRVNVQKGLWKQAVTTSWRATGAVSPTYRPLRRAHATIPPWG